MKKILQLFVLDWKRIFKSPLATLLFVALLILPALYCWFNVWALWDPYSNTSDLKIAVYAEDTGTKFDDKEINVGKELTSQLKHNDKLGWTFVSNKHTVTEGVKSGKYYAGIYVPKNFSKDLLTFVNGKVTKPKLEYYVNTKINAVAPKITDTGASTLQTTISDEFQTTVGKTLVTVLNKAGIDLQNNLPMLQRFASLITETNADLPTIEGYLNEIQTVKQKLPELDEKLDQANQITKFIPEINQFSTKLIAANQYLPLVDNVGQMSLQAQQNIPNIKNAGTLLNNADSNFDNAAETLDTSLTVLQQSSTLLTKLEAAMPDIKQFSQDAESLTTYTKDSLIPTLKAALPVVDSTVKSALSIVQTTVTDVNDLSSQLIKLINELQNDPNSAQLKKDIEAILTNMAEDTATITRVNTSLRNTLQNVEDVYNQIAQNAGLPQSTLLQPIISRLDTLIDTAKSSNQLIQDIKENMPQISSDELISKLNNLITVNKQISAGIDQLNALNIAGTVSDFLDKTASLLADASKSLQTVNSELLPLVPDLLTNTKTVLNQLTSFLKKVQTDTPIIKSALHGANTLVNDNMGTIVSGINALANLYKGDYPELKLKLTRLMLLAQNDLPRIERELTDAINLANEKMPEVKAGLATADKFIKEDWPTLKAGIQKGLKILDKVEHTVDMDKLIKLLKRDANKEANFLANPVELETNTLYPIPTYGSQSAPFYTALCIWVGALLLSSVISTDFVLSDKQKKQYSKRQQYFARYLTFLVVGLTQAIIVTLGNMFLIHAYVASPVWFVFTTMFIAFAFFSVLYSLVALFGNIGKGIGIIILVLSISGAGGNFPVVLSGKFFQAINPFLPFTYAVNALRETVGGIYWNNFRLDWLFLGGVGLLFLIIGAILITAIHPWIERIHKSAQKSMIIH